MSKLLIKREAYTLTIKATPLKKFKGKCMKIKAFKEMNNKKLFEWHNAPESDTVFKRKYTESEIKQAPDLVAESISDFAIYEIHKDMDIDFELEQHLWDFMKRCVSISEKMIPEEIELYNRLVRKATDYTSVITYYIGYMLNSEKPLPNLWGYYDKPVIIRGKVFEAKVIQV